MVDDAIVGLYRAVLTKGAKLYAEDGVSRNTGKGWTVVYVSWREIIKQGSFKRTEVRGSDMRRIKKFAVEFRQDTDEIKYTRVM